MKVDELRVLEADELGVRLRTARRELYELRFKHAVGQLENSSQIGKVKVLRGSFHPHGFESGCKPP